MRKWLTAGLLVMMAQNAQAQSFAGVKLGPSIANVKLSIDSAGNSSLLGFSGGFFMQRGKGQLALQFEIVEMAKGAKFTELGAVTDSAQTDKLKMMYVEVPVEALLTTRYAYAFGGPVVGLEASCFVYSKTGDIKFSNGCDNQTSGIFRRRKLEFSAVAGGGVKYPIGRRAIMLEGRYEWGFTNIDKQDGDPTLKNRVWAIFLGYGTTISARHH